jgi:hypothetical protein
MTFDEHELGIILIALNSFENRADAELSGMRGVTLWATRYCLGEVRKVIARIELYQKDEAEEKDDE